MAANVKMTHSVSSNEFGPCDICMQPTTSGRPNDAIHDKINHYLEHGCEILHVGTETTHDQDGRPWHSTVAVLASKK